MEIDIQENDAGRVLAIRGEATIYHAAKLRETLLAELNSQPEICLDLESVSEMDTATVQILVALLRTAAEQGKLVRIVKTGTVAEQLIRFCNLQEEFGLTLP